MIACRAIERSAQDNPGACKMKLSGKSFSLEILLFRNYNILCCKKIPENAKSYHVDDPVLPLGFIEPENRINRNWSET
jgi:hypothetical protein